MAQGEWETAARSQDITDGYHWGGNSSYSEALESSLCHGGICDTPLLRRFVSKLVVHVLTRFPHDRDVCVLSSLEQLLTLT